VKVLINAAGLQREIVATSAHADQRQRHGLVLIGLWPPQQAKHLLLVT